MWRLSGIVLRKASFEIGGYTDIAPWLGAVVFQQIHVTHGRPSFAKASEGILLRLEVGANPAKRVARSRMAETEGFEPSIGLYNPITV
jgi:hypothetical protein